MVEANRAKGKTRKPRAALSASSRERLQKAAKALFASRGYERTSTAAICRAAGTSQSQLINHFRDKLGLLEAIFEESWQQINPAIRLAIEKIPSAKVKLQMVTDMMLSFMEKDPALRMLFLLEGRRMRGDGRMVVLVPGFLEFVKIVDETLNEMAAKGELQEGLNPQALRSALIGAVEGLVRDRIISRPARFPAAYSEEDVRATFSRLFSSCFKPTI